MANREHMMEWIVAVLKARGGSGWPKEVAKDLWNVYESEIRASPNLVYSWQYDARWAAQKLRDTGVLKPVHGSTDLPWELTNL